MRLRALIVIAAATISVAACTTHSNDTTPSPTTTTTATFGALPAWNDKAPSSYSNISTFPKPADATVIRFYSDDNVVVGNHTRYNLDSIGDGIQVRYACTGTNLINGDHLAILVGTLDSKGDQQLYDRVDGLKQSDSFFFSWSWLAANVVNSGGRQFVEMQGTCLWEFNLLTFTGPKATPTS